MSTTRRILDSFTDETGLPVTPLFAAYMIEGGFRTYRDAQDSDGYDAWRAARMHEFAPGDPFAAPTRYQQFLDWLEDRVTDIKARQHVEAAA